MSSFSFRLYGKYLTSLSIASLNLASRSLNIQLTRSVHIYIQSLGLIILNFIQGIAPTLVYPVPSAEGHWLLSKVIHNTRDYYPLWQVRQHFQFRHRNHWLMYFRGKKKLVYRTIVFFSRASISIGIPALPVRLMSLPAIIQFFVFLTLMYESAVGVFGDKSESLSIFFVFTFISLEGVCGGLA